MTGRITEQELSTELNKKLEADRFPIATEAEAKAGQSDERYMTPLKVKQATPKNVPDGFAGLDDKGKLPASLFPLTPLVKIREVDLASLGTPTGFILTNILQYKRIKIKGTGLTQTDDSVVGGAFIRYNDVATNAYSIFQIGSSGSQQNQIYTFSGNSAQKVLDIDIDIDNTHPNWRTEITSIHSNLDSFLQYASHIFAGAIAKQASQINKISLHPRDTYGGISKWKGGKIEVWAELRE